MTKEERLEFIAREFETLITGLSATNSAFKALENYSKQEDLSDLIIQIFKKSDDKALNFINQNPREFVELFKELS